LGFEIAKKAWDTLPHETCAVIIAAIAASDMSVAFLGKENVYTAGEAMVWAAALGPEFDDRAALLARPLAPLASPQGNIQVQRRHGHQVLDEPLFSGCTNWPRLEKSKGKKRTAGEPIASVATAVDLGGEEGGEPPVKCSSSSLLDEAMCAMGALASDPRANAQYMEKRKRDVARRAT